MEYIFNRRGEVVIKSSNLRGIRRYVSENIVYCVSIYPTINGGGSLRIDFHNGDCYVTYLSDYEVLKDIVSRWKNLYGCLLNVDGKFGRFNKGTPLLKGD